MADPADTAALRQAIVEGTEYLVVGIYMPSKQRYADFHRADGPRQAEDLAVAAVRSEVVNGHHEELWVAGVVEHDDTRMKMADSYACFVDPDEVRND